MGISVSAGPHQNQGHLSPIVAFKTNSIPIAPILPFSPKGKHAVPEGARAFLVAGLGPVNPETQISPAAIDATAFDEAGGTYKPIAFGFPMKGSTEPLTMIGRLTSGDMKIVGTQKTFVGVIFVVPAASAKFRLKSKDGGEYSLALTAKYAAREEMRIADLLCSGRIDQDVKGDGWSVK